MKRKINIIFWFFWAIVLCLSLVEAITYSGFVTKHLGFNQFFLLALAGLWSGIVLVLRLVHKNRKLQSGNTLTSSIFIFLLFLYVALKVVNRLTYANFVFSKLHVQPGNLIWPVLVAFLPVLIQWVPRINFKKVFTTQFTIMLFVLLAILFNFYKTYKAEQWAFQFIIVHPFASYDDKMRRAVGSEFYNYTQFINKYTPKDSTILMPPQAFPWPQSGNGAFLRYFVYPRNLGNGEEFVVPKTIAKIDFILLAWGETPTVEAPYTHGWPKFDIPADEIIFMNRDGSFGGIVKGNYNYKDYKGKEVWGLIKVKH